jgi:hypothetical protein
MSKAVLILIAFISALSALAGSRGRPPVAKSQELVSEKPLTPQDRAPLITIATDAGSLGRPTNRYSVGDQILIAITMTNTSPSPQEVCTSSDIYQNLPKLTKEGKLVPYMQWKSYEQLNAQRNHTCQEENLPESVLLEPNEPKLADWFVLVDNSTPTGAEAWYDSLPPGKYELSIQRRLSCCDGPMLESNQITFEVVP